MTDSDLREAQRVKGVMCPEGYWVSGRGIIKMSDMVDTHLENAINWCQGREHMKGKLSELNDEVAARVDQRGAGCS